MKKSKRTFMNIINKMRLRMEKNHSCKDCIHFNDGDGDVMCDICDIEFNDCFEPIEGGETIDKT